MEQVHQLKYLFLPLFISLMGCQSDSSHSVTSKMEGGNLVVSIEGKPVVSYQYETLPPPKGTNPNYARSGFLHPINTLAGHRITAIHPEDHYHHFGVWNPWTHTLFEGDTIDFWNIGGGQATVRFAEFRKMDSTANSFTFQVLHEHVVQKQDMEKVALNEVQEIKIIQASPDHYFLDLKFDYSCATDSSFKILEYRYGGLGFRGTEEWNAQNSSTLTSEGKTRDEADGTTGRWSIIQGKLGSANGGVVLMSHPNNFNHPEPLRIWPSEMHEGNVFINYAPTKTKDWLFEPGKTYSLQYRLVIFDGEVTAETAENWWQNYTNEL